MSKENRIFVVDSSHHGVTRTQGSVEGDEDDDEGASWWMDGNTSKL
jgi:hypothetical protein